MSKWRTYKNVHVIFCENSKRKRLKYSFALVLRYFHLPFSSSYLSKKGFFLSNWKSFSHPDKISPKTKWNRTEVKTDSWNCSRQHNEGVKWKKKNAWVAFECYIQIKFVIRLSFFPKQWITFCLVFVLFHENLSIWKGWNFMSETFASNATTLSWLHQIRAHHDLLHWRMFPFNSWIRLPFLCKVN